MCIDWDIFWNALSSIGTIAAVVVALLITKWENAISNRKKIKIKFLNGYTDGSGVVTFEGFPDGKSINCITVEFINIGNRKVILDCIKLEITNKRAVHLTPPISIFDNNEMTLPCKMDIEEVAYFRILVSDFYKIIHQYQQEQGNLNNEIILKVIDTSGKEYKYNTGFKYVQYLQWC